MIEEFLEWTAWEMTPPPSYGVFHLTFFFVGLAVCFTLTWLLCKIDDKKHKALLLIVGALLVTFEVYKIAFRYVVIAKGDMSQMWWLFPFQLCSAPIYLCFVGALAKNEKIRAAALEFMLAFNLFSGFVAFTEPSGLVHEYWTLTLHAFVWHMLLIFIGLYLGFSGRAGRRLVDYKKAIIMFFILCVIAFGINCAFYGVSDGSMNNFYIGPANSPIIVFKDICVKYGWFVNDLLYIPLICLGAFLFYLPFALVRQKRANAEKNS